MFSLEKKNKKWPTKKRLIFKLHSQYFFAKISWTGLLVSRIDWCEGYWCGSTYMVVSSKTGKKWFFGVFLGCFWAYLRQPHDHIGWATPMPLASINSTNQKDQSMKFLRKNIENWWRWKTSFFIVSHFEFFFPKKKNCLCFFPMKTTLAFIWGLIFFCTIDGFLRILEKTSSELICTRLYVH